VAPIQKPGLAVGISSIVPRRVMRAWRNKEHMDWWKSVSQIKHVKLFIVGLKLIR
jgi:hypothetical protein